MNDAAKLAVRLTLEGAQYRQGLDKMQRDTQGALAGIERQALNIGKALGALGVGAAIANSVRSTAQLSEEVSRLATLSNASVKEFQGYAFAAERAGIGQEKFADILKDVQDKVGDFLQNGGGPLKDFFDNIAPRVGVTADQFRSLSGPDALQLYVRSLEKANLSQAELTFYMEAIASDSALLLPLLKNNGAEMARLADEAQRLGRVMDEDAIAAGVRFQDNMRSLEAQMDSLQTTIGNSLIPWLTKLSSEFLVGMKNSTGFFDALRTFGTMSTFERPQEGARKYREELQKLHSQRERLVNTEGVMANTSGLDGDIDRAQRRLSYFNELAAHGRTFNSDDQSTAEARRLGLVQPPRPSIAAPPKPARTGRAPKTAAETVSEADRYIEALKRQLQGTEDLNVAETTLRDIQSGRLGVVTAAQRESLLETARQIDTARELVAIESDFAAAAIDSARAQTAKREEYDKWLQALKDDTPTGQLEAQRAEMMRISEALSSGRLTQEEYLEIVRGKLGLVAEEAKQADSMANQFGLTMSSAFEQAVLSGGKLSDVVKGLAADLAQMVLRKQVTEPLGNFISTGLSALFPSFDGGGHTGSGPRSGGMDGKGGFLAMLHPNETVSDHSRGQGGGSVQVFYSIDARNADSGVAERLPQILKAHAAQVKASVFADMARGGSAARAVGR